MKKRKKFAGVVILVLACFAVGFLGKLYVESHPVFPWTQIYAATQDGTELLNVYFSDVKFEKTVLLDGDTSVLQYSSGDWIIQTDANGEKVVMIGLSADAANQAEENMSQAKADLSLVAAEAETELQKYVDIEYYLDTDATEDDDFYYITITEESGGRETGAQGYFVYYPDGTLFSATFSERVVDFPEEEEIMTAEEAYDIAYNAILEERDDLELAYEFSDEAVTLKTAQVGQVYLVEICGEKNSMEVGCTCVLYAGTGIVCEIAFTDY